MKKDLITRLNEGPIMCAEGYLFAMERRGYLSAGPFVPEVVLEHPEVVTQLHREFIRAGSDVVQAFTYYGHGIDDCHSIHRIEKSFVIEEVSRAGFYFDDDSDLYENPDDPLDQMVFEKDIRDRTSRFILIFKKEL